MNHYALYCQETKKTFGPFKAHCAGNFEAKLSQHLHDTIFDIKLSMQMGMRFALVDPNGSVLAKDLRVVKIDHELGSKKFLVRVVGMM